MSDKVWMATFVKEGRQLAAAYRDRKTGEPHLCIETEEKFLGEFKELCQELANKAGVPIRIMEYSDPKEYQSIPPQSLVGYQCPWCSKSLDGDPKNYERCPHCKLAYNWNRPEAVYG